MPSGRAEAVRITALLNIRNEWPLAAVAIVHCLLHHADDLYVLDHGSQDGTAAGLARLRNSPLGERLHLYELGEPAFHEEAFRNALVEIAQASEPGWIYSLDADEFLWAPSGLRPLLAGIPPAIQCLSYPLENWVGPPRFRRDPPGGLRPHRRQGAAGSCRTPPGQPQRAGHPAGTAELLPAPFRPQGDLPPGTPRLAAGGLP